MNYVIGGTPRSGKTALKNLMLKANGIPGICTDYLRDALEKTMPELGLREDMADEERSHILWPYFKQILNQRSKYYSDDLVIEGTNFLPSYLKDFKDDSNIRVIFLGYAEISPEEKFVSIRKYPSPHDEWTEDVSDEGLKKLVNEYIEISKYFKGESAVHGFKYFDTSTNFEATIKQAANYLINYTS